MQVCDAALGWLETHHYDRIMVRNTPQHYVINNCEKVSEGVCAGHARCVLYAWFHRSIAASRPQHNVLFLIINMTLDSI